MWNLKYHTRINVVQVKQILYFYFVYKDIYNKLCHYTQINYNSDL